ncbi:hypothetical protein GWC77_23420 [Paraburkholderia sp. NMBU_R16]|uniref:hypothetical protein n=1 Tax=Paraburkholderia sp. NMBU_R16 TaxID=2698676 RepID=UPI0015677677|nr:hypothetical protein [Paraburkholderia sp. NMBU_R16]NRO98864.1 hypothetical protein [Paraburkholderia sp. NMBU_R16]
MASVASTVMHGFSSLGSNLMDGINSSISGASINGASQTATAFQDQVAQATMAQQENQSKLNLLEAGAKFATEITGKA